MHVRSDVPVGAAFVEGPDIGGPLVDVRPLGTPVLVAAVTSTESEER